MKPVSTLILFALIGLCSLKGTSGTPSTFTISSMGNSGVTMLSSFLYTASGAIADGNRVVFGAQYSNSVDAYDAIKIANPGENFGLLRDHYSLAVEARQPIAAGDSIFFNMSHLSPQVYHLTIEPQNLSTVTLQCELVDRYLNTRQFINLSENNQLQIEITNNQASAASNRFYIVFTEQVIQMAPFSFNYFNGNYANNHITLHWAVENELNIQQYEVEHHSGSGNFEKISVKMPLDENNNVGEYTTFDEDITGTSHYYRIKAISKTGKITYSDPVTIDVPVISTSILQLYPNPSTGKKVQLLLNHLLPGTYQVMVTNYFGQKLHSKTLEVSGNLFATSIQFNPLMLPGMYTVSIMKAEKLVASAKLMIQ